MQQPEHDALTIHNHTLIPASCLDPLHDVTDAVTERTDGNITAGEISDGGRAGMLALTRQTVGKAVCFAGRVIKNLGETQTCEPPRSSGTQVSLPVIAVDNHRMISL